VRSWGEELKFDIEQYAKDNLERVRVTSTNQITAVCPFCERFGGFYISAKKGSWICFKCNERGLRFTKIVAFVEDMTDAEARRFIVKSSVQFRRKETPQSLLSKIKALRGEEHDEDEKVNFPLPEEFIPVYREGDWSYPTYLKQRGIKKETAKKWGLGYCSSGRYADRVIIPIRCPNGRSFEGRSIWDWKQPKTMGPKGADKSKLLLGWEFSDKMSDLTIVEGPFDALKTWQHGANVMALMGKNLSLAQFGLLCQRPADSAVVVMLDPEEVEAQYNVAAQLLCYFSSVYIARLPSGIDPGDATSKQFWGAYRSAKKYNGERNMVLREKIASSGQKIGHLFR